MDKRLFTSESVTEGHPDKMCHKEVCENQRRNNRWINVYLLLSL